MGYDRTEKQQTLDDLNEHLLEIFELTGEDEFTTKDVETDVSPLFSSAGTTEQLVERFYLKDATVVTTAKGEVVDEEDVNYVDMDLDTIYEICHLAEQYKLSLEKTQKRIQD